MRKLHLNYNIYGAFFVLVIMGLTAVTYLTTASNRESHTVQSQAAGTCGANCDNKSVWISDCLRYNGSDKTAQCNDWFNAECSACGNSVPTTAPDTGGGNDTGDNTVPFDPTATANDPAVQNLCGANPNDPRCCRINEWKNTNLGTNFRECSGGTGDNNTPTATPTIMPGGTGSCNNGQIPNGSWACFSRTEVIQCVNGSYQNKTSCTSCTGISANKSSICTGAGSSQPTKTPCEQNNPSYTVCPAAGNKCITRDDCNQLSKNAPSKTPCDQGNASYTICAVAGNKCITRDDCNTLSRNAALSPTPTVVQTANPDACGQPGASCCGTAFGGSACVTNGYECIAGKCRVGYAGFDDSSVTQVQTKLLECTTGSSGVQCTKPEVITVDQELIFNGCFALPNNQGFMCAE
ncbi:hypothetical protein IPM65_04515 [Candidatus Roizmanbacteria bacterium]|nr:MAG: hypothetical protein IPM65_04515 [Candidatus Roizmanbacteria bacterium]